MSRYNIYSELLEGVLGATRKMFRMYAARRNAEAGWLCGYGPDVPPDGTATGIVKGALWLKTGTGQLYQNAGSMASAAFVPFAGAAGNTAVENVAWQRPGNLVSDAYGPHTLVPLAATVTTAWAVTYLNNPHDVIDLDVERSGDNGETWASIFSTRLTIDANENTSTTAATPCVISAPDLAANDLLRYHVITGVEEAGQETVIGVELQRTI